MALRTKPHPFMWLLYSVGYAAGFHFWLYFGPKLKTGEDVDGPLIITAVVMVTAFAAGLFVDFYDFLAERYPEKWDRKSVRWLLQAAVAIWTTYAAIRAHGDLNALLHVNPFYAKFTLAVLTNYRALAEPLYALWYIVKYGMSVFLVLLVVYWPTPLWRPINRALSQVGLIDEPHRKRFIRSFGTYCSACFRVFALGTVALAGLLGMAFQPGYSELANRTWAEVVVFADFSSSHRCIGIPNGNKVLFTEPKRVVEARRTATGIKFVPRECEYQHNK